MRTLVQPYFRPGELGSRPSSSLPCPRMFTARASSISNDSGTSLFLTIRLGLIVYRIWTSSQSVASYHPSSLIPVILAVVESAGLYSSTLLALLIAYLSNSNGQYPALDVVMPLIVSRVSKTYQPCEFDL
jgi:hypothetical protein